MSQNNVATGPIALGEEVYSGPLLTETEVSPMGTEKPNTVQRFFFTYSDQSSDMFIL